MSCSSEQTENITTRRTADNTIFQTLSLRAFAKVRKATIHYAMSTSPYVLMEQLGTQWNTFSLNLTFQDFSNICPENSSLVKIGRE